MAGCLFALGACGENVGGPEAQRATLTIDARPLLQPNPNGGGPFQGTLVSVLDRVELTVTPGDTSVSVLSAPLSAEQPTATFEIQVPAGLQTFTGRVLSNNGTVLYEGSRAVEVRADGFAVELDLVPVAPVLAVTPDSISVPPFTQGILTVANLGSQTLEWWVTSVDPRCRVAAVALPCLSLEADGDEVRGEIPAGERDELHVSGNAAAQGHLFRVQLGSPVGSVEVKVYLETYEG